jgi:hypothetical protein
VTRATIGGLVALLVWALNLGIVLGILAMAGSIVVRFVFK